MATAERTYVDPSALARLYFPQEGSREMAAWRFRTPGAIPVTHHGRVELVNAIALSRFRGELSGEDMETGCGILEADFVIGRLSQVDILWRSALNRAAQLSRKHSPILGTRTLDVLHVSCALELELKSFLTFDGRQRRLAELVGLKIVELDF